MKGLLCTPNPCRAGSKNTIAWPAARLRTSARAYGRPGSPSQVASVDDGRWRPGPFFASTRRIEVRWRRAVEASPQPTDEDERTEERPPYTVYGFGWNGHGQLGTGDVVERSAPRPLKSLSTAGVRACLISCGSTHSCCIDQHGGVWTWGANGHGQLGVGDRGTRLEPTRITCDGQRVTDVAAGSSHTLLCTARGRAFACGSNEHGQCGLTVDEMADVSFAASPVGSSSTTLLQPMVITALLGLRIVHVAAGFNHSMLRSRPGGILTCGGGDLGQCGNGETAAVNAPPGSVSGLDATPASAIACGNFHSVALSREDGMVYTWGEGRYGRLGHGTVEIALTLGYQRAARRQDQQDRVWRRVHGVHRRHGRAVDLGQPDVGAVRTRRPVGWGRA